VVVAAATDNEPFAGDARDIAQAAGERATLVSGAGDGTGMYKDHPGLVDAIVRWADRAVRLDGS